jgi:hypothetical protein
MRKLFVTLLSACAFLCGACSSIINLGNEETDAYALVFPDTDIDPEAYELDNPTLAWCHNVAGLDNGFPDEYIPMLTNIPVMEKRPIFLEDREKRGKCQLFGARDAPGFSGYGIRYLYVVPSAYPDQYLPTSLSKGEFIALLDNLYQASVAGALDRTQAQDTWDLVSSAGYPFCGTVDLTTGLSIIHEQIFGE